MPFNFKFQFFRKPLCLGTSENTASARSNVLLRSQDVRRQSETSANCEDIKFCISNVGAGYVRKTPDFYAHLCRSCSRTYSSQGHHCHPQPPCQVPMTLRHAESRKSPNLFAHKTGLSMISSSHSTHLIIPPLQPNEGAV